QVHSSANTQRNSDHASHAQNHQRTDDSVGHAAAGFPHGFGDLREEGPVQPGQSPINYGAKDQEQGHSYDEREESNQTQCQSIGQAPAPMNVVGGFTQGPSVFPGLWTRRATRPGRSRSG